MSIRSWTSGQLRAGMRRMGREVVPYTVDHFPDLHLARLLKNHGITLALDVGANMGQTGRELREAGFDGRIVSFEPQAKPFGTLAELASADGKWVARQEAVGDAAGTLEMHTSGTSWSSSFLPMAPQHIAVVPDSVYCGSERVAVVRLDDVFDELVTATDRVYLKVDTQGYEASVLRGARVSLGRIKLVRLELLLGLLYVGQPRYFELMREMDEAGFDLVGIHSDFRERKLDHFLVADAIFARRP